MINLPAPHAAERIAEYLAAHPSWSAFWDKNDGVRRVAEDDPDSVLYAASSDVDTIIAYMAARP